ncbi:hypothetical protein [Mycobacterium sp. Lab-001]|uniref:hypothetical protein n=1 Tax=Mycobacterium sp. Lab-001 TaxID=3410136 RepID=UPI003D17A14D
MVGESLVGLRRRCRINAVKTGDALSRACCNELATPSVGSITDYVTAAGWGVEFTGKITCPIEEAHRALSGPETEVAQDEYGLRRRRLSHDVVPSIILYEFRSESMRRLPRRPVRGRGIREGQVAARKRP